MISHMKQRGLEFFFQITTCEYGPFKSQLELEKAHKKVAAYISRMNNNARLRPKRRAK